MSISGTKFTALAYRKRLLAATPIYFNTEENAIEVCIFLLRSAEYYQILLYDPTGKNIATYRPEQLP